MDKRAFALSLVALAAFALPAAAADKLHLYNWNNYIAPETIKRFEAECKCEVVQTYYSDNEELLAKLAAGAKGYDILVPTGNAVEALIKGGQLQPLDKAKLPNVVNVDPAYLNTSFDPGNRFSVPYAMSTTSRPGLEGDSTQSSEAPGSASRIASSSVGTSRTSIPQLIEHKMHAV